MACTINLYVVSKSARIRAANLINGDRPSEHAPPRRQCVSPSAKDHIILGETALAGTRARSGYRHAGSQTNRSATQGPGHLCPVERSAKHRRRSKSPAQDQPPLALDLFPQLDGAPDLQCTHHDRPTSNEHQQDQRGQPRRRECHQPREDTDDTNDGRATSAVRVSPALPEIAAHKAIPPSTIA